MRAIICGYYGKGNGGDEALLVSLLQMLPQQVKPVVLSHNPGQTSKSYQVESCPARSTFAILKALKESQMFIWGGGSLMQDVTSFASPIYYAGLMALAQQQGLKTIAWAQGIGPLKRPFIRWLTQRVLRGCTAVSVRDYASAKLVSEWNISPLIAPDPVWALQSKPVSCLSDLPKPIVAVNLRAHPLLTSQRLEVFSQALINFQRASNSYIILVPFQASQDLDLARFLQSRLQGASKIISLEDPRELKGLFRGVDMVIGMRYHSLIMAAAEGCRCFALSYDPKVTRLMEEINIPGWVLEELPDTANEITTPLLEYYVNGQPLDSNQIHSLVDKALMHRQLLM